MGDQRSCTPGSFWYSQRWYAGAQSACASPMKSGAAVEKNPRFLFNCADDKKREIREDFG